ncbi:MAG TPA: hypothetical protein VJO35_09325 [Terriglobales bacterium]|nr:hypothetical protein [Terriglobales bacterium]
MGRCLKASGRDFAVILMSGYTETSALEMAKLGKDVVLLSKPFTVDTLATKILEIKGPGAKSRAHSAGA